ncbi:MAG: heavy-metal-associated domain-containing protein [Nonlabens sp.]
MKNIFKKISYILILFIGFTALAQTQEGRDLVEVQVDGLGCPFCAYGLEKKFKEFKGIDDIAIDIETGDFSFSYPADKKIGLKAILEQVKKAGYTPNEAKITRANGAIVTSSKNTTKKTTDMEEMTFFVNGKCGMCKSRIEKTLLNVQGVAVANWDQKSKTVTVLHDPSTVSKKEMQHAVAGAGHDTKNVMADDQDYNSLPPCCNYKRESK